MEDDLNSQYLSVTGRKNHRVSIDHSRIRIYHVLFDYHLLVSSVEYLIG